MNKKLGICIPTYNRSSLLKENILNLIIQVKKYKIPIYISDNASKDDTLEVVIELKKKYDYIFFRKNKLNIGFDRNVLKVVEMSETEYCWIFGDDDLAKNGFIDRIYNEILENKYELIIVNSATYTHDMKELVEERHFDSNEDKIYSHKEFNKILLRYATYTTYVGSLVIKKENWDKIEIKDFNEIEDFVHIKKIYEYISIFEGEILFISNPYLNLRLANATWSKRKYKIWNINWPNTIKSLKKYDKEIKEKIIAKITLKKLIIERAKGCFDIMIYRKYFLNKKEISNKLKILSLFICLIPRNILKKIYLRKLKKNKDNGYKYKIYELEGEIIK